MRKVFLVFLCTVMASMPSLAQETPEPETYSGLEMLFGTSAAMLEMSALVVHILNTPNATAETIDALGIPEENGMPGIYGIDTRFHCEAIPVDFKAENRYLAGGYRLTIKLPITVVGNGDVYDQKCLFMDQEGNEQIMFASEALSLAEYNYFVPSVLKYDDSVSLKLTLKYVPRLGEFILARGNIVLGPQNEGYLPSPVSLNNPVLSWVQLKRETPDTDIDELRDESTWKNMMFFNSSDDNTYMLLPTGELVQVIVTCPAHDENEIAANFGDADLKGHIEANGFVSCMVNGGWISATEYLGAAIESQYPGIYEFFGDPSPFLD